MNAIRIILLLTTIITFIAISQGQKNFIKISKTEDFFIDFEKLKNQPQRGEFETFSEYKKRLPIPYDSSKIIFLRIERSISNKLYSYDIENERLTFAAGTRHTREFEVYKLGNGTPIEIYKKVEKQREYVASNAFGKKVKVQEINDQSYVLNLNNLGYLPDSIYDRDESTFKLSINRLPKEAQKLIKSVSLVIGFKPVNPNYSASECYYISKPTIDSPSERAMFHYIVDAKFISLLLYDNNTKKIILQYDYK